MRVDAYRVIRTRDSDPLVTILGTIGRTGLNRRLRVVGNTELRVEEVQEIDGLWLMDFVKFRFQGPGRAHRARQIRGFRFERDEAFGEETAVLYDPRTHHAVVQYNHYGVRAGSAAEYLSTFVQNSANQYHFEPMFDEHVERRLARKTIFRKLHFKVATRPIRQADRDAGQSLTRVLDAGRGFQADEMTVTLACRRGNRHGLSVENIHDAIRWLKQRFGVEEEAVQSIRVSGKDALDMPTEILDLIGQQLTRDDGALPPGQDLRYPREPRWQVLQRARNAWADEFQRRRHRHLRR